MSRLFKVCFRAFLVPEGFRCPATIVTVADTAKDAVEFASRWYQRNHPYNMSAGDPRSACLDQFEAVELEFFVCYGMEVPLLWEFPMKLQDENHNR